MRATCTAVVVWAQASSFGGSPFLPLARLFLPPGLFLREMGPLLRIAVLSAVAAGVTAKHDKKSPSSGCVAALDFVKTFSKLDVNGELANHTIELDNKEEARPAGVPPAAPASDADRQASLLTRGDVALRRHRARLDKQEVPPRRCRRRGRVHLHDEVRRADPRLPAGRPHHQGERGEDSGGRSCARTLHARSHYRSGLKVRHQYARARGPPRPPGPNPRALGIVRCVQAEACA